MKHLFTAALICAGGVFLSAAAFAQERREIPEFRTFGEPISKAHAQGVDRFLAEFKSAWGEQDTAALMAMHAADVEWINAYARIFRESEPLGTFLEKRLFPAFDPSVSKMEAENMTTISIRYLGDDAAVIHLYTDGNRGESRVAGALLRRTHIHLVLENQADGWKITHTAIMDAR